MVVGTWDPDGDGPDADWLIAAGDSPAVMAFDATTWFQLGGLLGGSSVIVRAMTAWDPDGDGPEPELLIIGGDFTTIDGAPFPYIAAWDGGSWRPLGAGFAGPVRALTTWDADNDPVTPDLLLAGGSRISTFDGTTWSPVDGTDDDFAYALTVWDRDGDGPDAPVVCAAGAVQTEDAASINGVSIWNGVAWEHLAPAPPVFVLPPLSTINELVAGDPDGPGPAPFGLALVATFGQLECLFWDGAGWFAFTEGIDAPLTAAIIGDPDGNGPLGDHLIIGGNFNPGPPAWRDEYGWQPLGSPLGRIVHKLALWDSDGSGPGPETVFVGGAIFGGTLQGVAELKDGRWQKLGAGPAPYASPYDAYSTFHLRPWRSGPSPHDGGVLVAVGEFVPSSLGLPTNAIPLWNGAAWSSIPAPPDPGINAITVWDADGPGPLPESLIIANSDVYAHDGTAWTSLSTAACPVKFSAIAWDTDGAGPETPRLISWNPSVGHVWRSTSEWSPMPGAFTGQHYFLCALDPDGNGPEPQWLMAMHDANDEHTSAQEYRIDRWNGVEWSPLTTPFVASGLYSFFTILDRDGAGPGAPAVIVGRFVGFVGEQAARDLLIFESGAWTELASVDSDTSTFYTPWTALPITRAIQGFPAGSLFVGGTFEEINQIRSLNTAALRACAPAPCRGDTNSDHHTGIDDFQTLAFHFGAGPNATRAEGDLSGDGLVNIADFNILAGDFGCSG